MLNARIKSNIKFPDITLLDEMKYAAKNIIIPDIIMGIDKQMAIVGGKLRRNMPATLKYKRGNKSLIDTGELRRSFFYKAKNKFSVIISIKNIRKKIGEYLQERSKPYLFFGISKDAEKRTMNYMRKKIKDLTRARA